MLRTLIVALAAWFLALGQAQAADALQAKAKASCGGESYTAGQSGFVIITTTGRNCGSAIIESVTPGTTAALLGKAEDAVAGSGDTGVAALILQQAAPADNAGDGDYAVPQESGGFTWVANRPAISTISATITRPGDTNAYTIGDAYANSTSSPTAGGFTFTAACRASGGYGTITDAVVTASASTAYQGEIWIFDQAVTAINDNAAFAITDGEAQTVVGVIPFTTNDTTSNNAVSYVTGLNIGYTCVGTANLRFLVKIMNAPTPGNGEVLSVRIKVNN